MRELASLLDLGLNLGLARNRIADLDGRQHIATLYRVDLTDNKVADLGPLVHNAGFGDNDFLLVTGNLLDCGAQAANLQALRDRGVQLESDCPWTLGGQVTPIPLGGRSGHRPAGGGSRAP